MNLPAALADAETCIRLSGGAWEKGHMRKEAVVQVMHERQVGEL
jgi:hypothetical protein